jgi:hypothetical protein
MELQGESTATAADLGVKTATVVPKKPWATPFLGLFGRMALAASSGGATFLLAQSPLAQEASAVSYGYGAAGVVLGSLPFYSDAIPFVGGAIKSWEHDAVVKAKLENAIFEDQEYLKAVVELKARLLESAAGAVSNAVLGSIMSNDYPAAITAAGGGVVCVLTGATLGCIANWSVRRLGKKKMKTTNARAPYDLASQDKETRNQSHALLKDLERFINASTVLPILLGVTAGAGGVVVAAWHQHKTMGDDEFKNHYAYDRLIPTALSFLVMSAYLIAMVKAQAAKPTATARANAAILSNEREAYTEQMQEDTFGPIEDLDEGMELGAIPQPTVRVGNLLEDEL